MKQLTYSLSALILFISLSACAQNKRKGNGSLVTKERSIEHFDALKVSGSFNVEMTSNRKNQLSIYTDENLIEDIITEVKDGTLIIRTKKNSYFKTSNWKSIKIKIPLVALKSAKLSGSGKIHSQEIVQSNHIKTSLSGSGKIVLTIATQKLSSQLSGSGKIQLKGKAQAVAAKLSGSGSIRLQEVKAKDAEATLAGSGSIYLSCSNDLDATVAGSGRIRYFGEPAGKIHTKVAGSGSIRLATE